MCISNNYTRLSYNHLAVFARKKWENSSILTLFHTGMNIIEWVNSKGTKPGILTNEKLLILKFLLNFCHPPKNMVVLRIYWLTLVTTKACIEQIWLNKDMINCAVNLNSEYMAIKKLYYTISNSYPYRSDVFQQTYL